MIANLPKQIIYNPNTRLGKLEPYVLIMRRPNSRFSMLYWHVSEEQLYKLEGGEGKLYGRQEYGPWCELRVFRYRVLSFKKIDDKEKIREIEEELFS